MSSRSLPRRRVAVLVLTAVAAGASAAAAQQPQPALTLEAARNPTVWDLPTTLSGRVDRNRATTIRLQADSRRPYDNRYRIIAITRSAADGTYAFTVRPQRNTQYRTVALTRPRRVSPPRLVTVRFLTGLIPSTRELRAGSRMTFRGSVWPARPGRPVHLQRRSPSGSFVTVARSELEAAEATRSAYAFRHRVERDGRYRVKVVGDLDNVNGFSRTVAIDVRTGS